MDKAARRYTTWVLAIHLLLLAGVVLIVILAAREVYENSRQQALDQAGKRQMLLAEQTARGIEQYYISIIDTFALYHNADNDGSAIAGLRQMPGLARGINREVIAPALWQQLKNRASMFFGIGRPAIRLGLTFPVDQAAKADQILAQSADWLRAVQYPTVGPLLKFEGEDVNLVAVPANTFGALMLVAVVPLRNIDKNFLQRVHSEQHMSAVLLDENMRVLTAADRSIVGLSVIEQGSNPKVRELAERYSRLGKAGTEIIENKFMLGTHQFESGVVSLQPVELMGKRWWLSMGSDLSEVKSVIDTTFRRAMIWSIIFIVSVTAILVSTAAQMIWSRMRFERAQHELLTREISQARRIQLAWLPKSETDLAHIDLSAVNMPASHISGDFYNWFALPDGRVCVMIGDVTGHGMGAAFLMATTQLLVKIIMPRVPTPGRCLKEVNRQLCQQIFSGQFVTMQILALNPQSGRVEIATAGHPPPLIGAGDEFVPLKIESQFVLGVDASTDYPTESFELSKSSAIVLYTDGLTDAQAPTGDRFGLEGVLQSLTGQFRTSKAVAERIVAGVNEFRRQRELCDDLTLVTIQMQPPAAPGTTTGAA